MSHEQFHGPRAGFFFLYIYFPRAPVLSLVPLKRLISRLKPADRRLIFGLSPCFTCNTIEHRRLTGLDRRLTPFLKDNTGHQI
jgi:hypothetical protein